MAITPLPDAPSRSDTPADFIAKSDAFVAALPVFVTEANAVAEAMNLNDTTSTSTTSVVIGTGAKSLTVEASKSYVPGMTVKIARTSDGTKWMVGDVTSYDSGTGALGVTVSKVLGSGTFTDWTISLAATEQIDDLFIENMTTATLDIDADYVSFAKASAGGDKRKGLIPAASDTVKGAIELATVAEAISGTDTARAITPATLFGGLNASGSAPIYACRAWVNFSGSGTVAIRAAGNIGSVTDNGVGDYTANITNALPDVDYAVTGTASGTDGTDSTVKAHTLATTSCRVRTTTNGSSADISIVSLALIR